ncbi:hypothetical protein HK099_001504, partial [Clydaea vesicula]
MIETKYDLLVKSMVHDFLDLAAPENQNNKWSQVAKVNEGKILVFKLVGSTNCFKVIAELDTSAATAFDILADVTRRIEWDELCEFGQVIERIDNKTT